MITKLRKVMGSILCHMILKILNDAFEELFNVIIIKLPMRKLGKMLLIVSLKKKMLPKGGTLSSIDSRTRSSWIGLGLKRKSLLSKKMTIISKKKTTRKSEKKDSIGAKIGTLNKISKQSSSTLKGLKEKR